MSDTFNKFVQIVKHPVRFRMFLFLKLPSAFFSGVRVKEISADACTVIVRYKWFSQNPFKSTYFACLAMAAELSTGALAMGHCYKSDAKVSMLVTSMNGSFTKKATGITSFTCADGNTIRMAIGKAIRSNEASTMTATSIGLDREGATVAVFTFEWSFKVKRYIPSSS